MMEDADASVCVSFSAAPDQQEILIATLIDFPFSGFEQTPDQLFAYLARPLWTDRIQRELFTILSRVDPGQKWSVSTIPSENWNELRESKIDPVQAGKFYIHPPWRDDEGMKPRSMSIVIDPRMSFGTGHHESTRLALRHLSDESDFSGPVLDVGTGTGILSIAAALSGATSIVAVDTDPWCISNARDNIRTNGVSFIRLRLGSLDVVADEIFSLILANINKNVLEEMIPAFKRYVIPGTRIILSGLLISDENEILSCLKSSGYATTATYTEGEWWSVKVEPV